MSSLPTGTVTFLLTDVEGSTTAWERDPQAMRAAVAALDRLVSDVISEYAGTVVKPRGEGDSHFCVFGTATDAVAAGVDLLRRVRDVGLSVRAAVHTGEADLRDGDYYGRTVNRAARLRSAGHGGQLLVSEVSAGLVRGNLGDEIGLVELGRHQLKDLSSAESVFEAVHLELPRVMRPLTTLDFQNKLRGVPAPRDRFVGREDETAALLIALRSGRLVTIVGPGGTGKTRLAAEVAGAVADEYADGVWFVELDAVRDDQLVPDRIRAALRAPLAVGTEVQDALNSHFAPLHALLVLDNCEQVLRGVAEVVDGVFDAAPRLTVLTTSRAALGVRGEVVRELAGLAVSQAGDAMTLFVERARAIAPSFDPNPEELQDIAALCRRLEGSPLAIELAAARAGALSAREILDRLGERLDILSRRGAASSERHGSLHAAIDWSHELLGPEEQAVFRRASAFAGSFTLAAAEQICSDSPTARDAVVDAVSELVAKSLLAADRRGATTRYRMNEATRLYARDRLGAAGEDSFVALAHRAWYRQVALEAEPHLKGRGLTEWLDRLDDDIDDLRLAMRTAIRDGESRIALEVATSLLDYWRVRGNWKEGQEWLDGALASQRDVDLALVSRALEASAVLADLVSDYPLCERRAGELLELARSAHDRGYEVRALQLLGVSHLRRGDDALGHRMFEDALAILRTRDDPASHRRALALEAELTESWPRALRHLEDSLELTRVEADPQELSGALLTLGHTARMAGDPKAAAAAFEEALAIASGLGYDRYIARATMCLGELALDAGDTATARPLIEGAANLWPNVGHLNGVADSLLDLAELARLEGDLPEADSLARRALTLSQSLSIRGHEAEARRALAAIARERQDLEAARRLALESAQLAAALPDLATLALALEVLAGIATSEGRFAEAARLFGVADGIRQRIGLALTHVERRILDKDRAHGEEGNGAEWRASFEAARLARPEDVLISLGIEGSVALARDSSPAGKAAVTALFRREGSHVTLAFGGPPFTVAASKGTDYIETLLRRQGEEIHVLELAGGRDGSSGPMIDDEAREQYRRRLEDLREDAAEAEAFNDPERAARAEAEIEKLASELSRAVGLGGRTRLANSAAERARVNVTRAIRSAIQRIASHDLRMGHHLEAAVRTGTYCSYMNDPVTPVTWSLSGH